MWGIGENTLFEFISNIDLVNAVLIWRWDIFFDALRHLILPALALATIPMAVIARMTRSSLLDVLGLDYVRTARAKGLRERIVIGRPRCATRCCRWSPSSACRSAPSWAAPC